LIWILLAAVTALVVLVVVLFAKVSRTQASLSALPGELVAQQAAEQGIRHREMLTDLAEGLAKQGDRIGQSQLDAGERLRTAVAQELTTTREAVAKLQLEQSQGLATLTQTLSQKQDALKAEMLAQTLEKLAEQSRAQTENMQATMRTLTQQISERVDMLTKTNDTRLAEISGKVNERLEEGFKKTNETFVNVMTRLATIDEAQKKLDGLTTNVVSLQQLLGDKKSRGAFGEMQLEQIIRNMLPETSFEFQYGFSTGGQRVIADCVLKLPDPVGLIAVDSKFPLENYERMISDEADRVSPAVFKADVKKHVEAIASKYIIPGVTSDGAMMFVPAEAVFAEIHARHRDIVEFAQQRRVWIVSPTTLMAVLNTVRAVLKDVETRKQIHIIKDELGKLGKEFGRFDERMRKLAEHIRQANKDVDDVAITSKKISDRFQSIERVELDHAAAPTTVAPNLTLIKSDTEN
jgi:DNA recombination protein RmuC